ncbi:hypothetical protein [Streptomyces sp. NPDC047070]|uniref:hypothetical protein n=1 Tax=Streptomyces sp. NPDC047070 TaxID=3154923 RepID=UPI003451EE2C
MEPTTAVVASTVTAKACALLALWIRLRWRAQREQQRQRYLVQVAGMATSDSHLELHDRGPDGHCLHVVIARTPVPGEDQAA